MTDLSLCPSYTLRYVNYALSVTDLSLRDYTLSTALGTLPGALLFTYIGEGIKNVRAYMSGEEEQVCLTQ